MALRWGIIGCGFISNDFVRSLSVAKENHKVVAAAASTLQRAEDFIKKVGLTNVKAYGSYDELLADNNVDVAYIGLLNDCHVTWTVKAIKAGKHVLCEKPLGVNVKEVKLMIETAKSEKKFLMEAFWSRFFPVWLDIKEKIAARDLGDLRVVNINFGVLLADTRKDVTKGSTPLYDIGLYTVSLALYAFGKKRDQNAWIGAKDKHGADAWANITLQFGDDQRAVLYYDANNRPVNNAILNFENGSIQIPDFFWCPNEYTLINRKTNEHTTISHSYPGSQDNYHYNHSSGLSYEADHVYKKIQEGQIESERMSHDDSVAIHEVLEKVRKDLGVVFPQD
uniref:Trans-1,2-dihydrobenzene-1,2-diol dehydrogenase n=1 Tax=Bursaphelenchus xylophilus TaxID=6326 RepID=A0A1I7RHI3_BURXY